MLMFKKKILQPPLVFKRTRQRRYCSLFPQFGNLAGTTIQVLSGKMPRNIEIKAKVSQPEQLRLLTEKLSESSGNLLTQEDTFYIVPNGRLKLRRSSGEGSPCRLYFYNREDVKGPKMSDYHFVNISDPDQTNVVLGMAMGVLGVVKKTRQLCMVGQTRVHLDNVDNLGHFMELEVVLRDDQSAEDGTRIAEELMKSLNIQSEDLIDCAYIDLLLRK